MSKTTIKLAAIAALSGCAAVFAPLASALDVTMSGFIRQEMAYKISNEENPANRGGFPYNGETQILDSPLLANVFGPIPPGGLPCGFVTGSACNQPDKSTDNDWNVFATKAELDFSIQINQNWTGFAKLRGYYQPDVFDEADVHYPGESPIENGDDTDHFGVKNFSNGEATYLSYSNEDYMIDIPALYLDYQKGAFWMRIGQQQIAWGEALFFRVADVANGLDLRRHVFFDLGAEEYADERLASPGIRASYVLSDTWQIEGFAQMFQPSVLPTRTSPMNLVYSPFGLNNHDGFQKVKDNVNVGVRLQGTFGDLEVQAFAVSRHNPDPIFTLSAGGQQDGPFGPGGFATQPFIYDEWVNFAPVRDADGTTSSEMWMWAAGLGGLDGVEVLDSLIQQNPWVNGVAQGLLLLTPNADGSFLDTYDEAIDVLDVFFAFGGISGNLDVVYAAEEVFGFGFNYINYAEPDSLLDQLVVRFEASYTPDKKFTGIDLHDFIVEDEYVFSVVLEKYHRFSQSFPATFFIFEWMHKSESDLLGRHLSGLGGTESRRVTGGEENGGWDGLVFAFQQPFPNLVWRADLSVLWDLNGGIFIQPAVRYKPSGNWTVEAFANLIDSKDNASIFATTDWSDDLTVRLTYQF
ncbi:MAG: DUF1302 family protein [Porticoccaceae bacterium]